MLGWFAFVVAPSIALSTLSTPLRLGEGNVRISREQMFLRIAETVALRSTCHRLNVGAVLVSASNNILSIGYNGSPSGMQHCTGQGCPYFIADKGCQVIHAEANALKRDRLSASPVAALGCALYVTHSPCMVCAKLIAAHPRQITHLIYGVEYRDTSPVEWLIQNSPIDILRLSPSGYLLSKRDNTVREV